MQSPRDNYQDQTESVLTSLNSNILHLTDIIKKLQAKNEYLQATVKVLTYDKKALQEENARLVSVNKSLLNSENRADGKNAYVTDISKDEISNNQIANQLVSSTSSNDIDSSIENSSKIIQNKNESEKGSNQVNCSNIANVVNISLDRECFSENTTFNNSSSNLFSNVSSHIIRPGYPSPMNSQDLQDNGFNDLMAAKSMMHNYMSDQQKKKFECNICHRTYTNKNNLKTHMNVHDASKCQKCTVCWKTFATKQQLNQHMRRHTGEKPFMCNICGQAFSQLGPLTKHKQTHVNEMASFSSDCRVTL